MIGPRGAGSTLGRALTDTRDVPFLELSAATEREAGASLSGIHALYRQAAYRRYEVRVPERALREHDRFVLATPGISLLLAQCYTVWVRPSPEEHMARVVAQGDMRPMEAMEGNSEALADLRHIL